MIQRIRKAVFRAGTALVLLILIVPFVSAAVDSATVSPSRDPNYADRPEALALLKTHIAWVGGDQNNRMEGTIRYIDRLSNGTGTVNLRQIQDDYLVTASSVPLMRTAADIYQARGDLQAQALLFSNEAKKQMGLLNGSSDGLMVSIRAVVNRTERNGINSTTGPLWLRNESARLTLFNQESNDRAIILKDLKNQGIDITVARNLSEQIDAQRPGLVGALTNKSSKALTATNAVIKNLNRQFRQNVADSRAFLMIEMKKSAMMAM